VAITGIGHIEREAAEKDQLVANLTEAVKDPASPIEMAHIEEDATARHAKDTNYFQEKTNTLVQPSAVRAQQDGERIRIEWNTAIAGREPVRAYQIVAGSKVLLTIPFRPQLSEAPHYAFVPASEAGGTELKVVAVAGA